jgi:hypothetical protein
VECHLTRQRLEAYSEQSHSADLEEQKVNPDANSEDLYLYLCQLLTCNLIEILLEPSFEAHLERAIFSDR